MTMAEQKLEKPAAETGTNYSRTIITAVALSLIALMVALVTVGYLRVLQEPDQAEAVERSSRAQGTGAALQDFSKQVEQARRRGAESSVQPSTPAQQKTTRPAEPRLSAEERAEAAYARKARRGEMILQTGLQTEAEGEGSADRPGRRAARRTSETGAPALDPADALRSRLQDVNGRADTVRRVDGVPD